MSTGFGTTLSLRPAPLPLAALRAFEAAARHGSMSAAAAELNVTHGAISRQIAALERLAGFAVFSRGARGVGLTSRGSQLFHEVHGAFERLRSAFHAGAEPVRTPVSLTTLPSFASRWLMPRLAGFNAEHPGIQVRVHTGLEIADLGGRPGHDLAIRYGRGTWKGVTAEPLLGGDAFPVCSPDFLAKVGAPDRAADLLHLPLVHDSGVEWWADWFRAHGVTGPVPAGVVVDDYALALDFALDGHGLALGRSVLVRSDLARGRLVRPFGRTFMLRLGYYLARAAGHPLGEDALLFAGWLRAAARNERPPGLGDLEL